MTCQTGYGCIRWLASPIASIWGLGKVKIHKEVHTDGPCKGGNEWKQEVINLAKNMAE